MLRFRVSESLSVDEFLRVGQACASLIRLHAGEMGTDLDHAGRVLDFGCGCGRTARWFLPGLKNTEFHGVDVDADAVGWCRQYLSPGQFAVNGPAPPLAFSAEHFDVIYCLSVFTHLDEAMQDLWLSELARILKPDGILLLTVHGKIAAQSLDATGQRELQSIGFVHRRSPKLRSIVPDWYQTSWHSEEYIVKRLSVRFREVRYCPISDSIQDMVLARRNGVL
jgi:SAM-dependent methyltransferase